jgi:hypothetical protein
MPSFVSRSLSLMRVRIKQLLAAQLTAQVLIILGRRFAVLKLSKEGAQLQGLVRHRVLLDGQVNLEARCTIATTERGKSFAQAAGPGK